MDARFDVGFLKLLCNNRLLQEKNIAPLIKVMNKYGISGLDCITFLTDIAIAAQEMQDAQNGGDSV